MAALDNIHPTNYHKRKEEYSLWIVPPNNIYEILADMIVRLSHKYSAPTFEPHVTLLGDITTSKESMISKTAELSKIVKSFEVRLTTVSYLDEYFRSLYINAAKTNEIMEAHQKARRLFNINTKGGSIYRPHLSLMYGHYSMQVKEEVVSEIGSEFNMVFTATSICIVLSSPNINLKDWRIVKQFNLTSKQGGYP